VGDKLIIAKFCMIASDVTFIMNGGNHLRNSISAYPFAIFGGDWKDAMENKTYPYKDDIIIGNDVWLGYKCTIMPGLKIGDGAIIASNSTVVKNVEPYSIVGGNPAKLIRKRFTEEQIEILLQLKWWNRDIEKITRSVKILTGNDVNALREMIK